MYNTKLARHNSLINFKTIIIKCGRRKGMRTRVSQFDRILFFYGQAVRRPGGLGASDVADDGQAVGRPFGLYLKSYQQASVRLAPTLAQT